MRNDLLVILSLCMLLTACEVPVVEYQTSSDVALSDAREPPINIGSLEELYAYMGTLRYIRDPVAHNQEEFWQCPYETWYRRGGDCEDHAIFIAYYARLLGYEASIVGVDLITGEAHALVRLNGVLIDSLTCKRIPLGYIEDYIGEWSVEEALGICRDRYESE